MTPRLFAARLARLGLVVACTAAAMAGARSVRAGDHVPTLAIGSAAPDFDLPGVDGKNHSLKSFAKDKVLVIVWTCVHCPTAQGYEERIKTLVNDYKGKSVSVVMISPNDPDAVRPDELGYTDLSDSLADMKVRARDRKFNCPFLFGGGEHEAVAKAYGPVATPHAFVFDATRKLRYAGRIDDNEREPLVKTRDLRDAIDAVLADRAVAVATTKVFGCSTKWSEKREGVKAFWDKIAAEPVDVAPVDAAALKALRANKPAAGKDADDVKVRLINVWATWCGPCVTEFPDLMMMNRMYRNRDFELVTVAAQFPDERADVLKFLHKQQASNANYLFAGTDKYKLIEAFDPAWDGALPYTLLVGTDGSVLYRGQGPVDALTLKRAVVKALNARRPWKG